MQPHGRCSCRDGHVRAAVQGALVGADQLAQQRLWRVLLLFGLGVLVRLACFGTGRGWLCAERVISQHGSKQGRQRCSSGWASRKGFPPGCVCTVWSVKEMHHLNVFSVLSHPPTDTTGQSTLGSLDEALPRATASIASAERQPPSLVPSRAVPLRLPSTLPWQSGHTFTSAARAAVPPGSAPSPLASAHAASARL
jgi:hypothetical protein